MHPTRVPEIDTVSVELDRTGLELRIQFSREAPTVAYLRERVSDGRPFVATGPDWTYTMVARQGANEREFVVASTDRAPEHDTPLQANFRL